MGRRKGEDTVDRKRRRMPFMAKIRRDDPFRSADQREIHAMCRRIAGASEYCSFAGWRPDAGYLGYDEREPAPETYTLHWEFDAWLIADEPYHSLTPLQARSPVPWQEAPQRLTEFLKRSASPA